MEVKFAYTNNLSTYIGNYCTYLPTVVASIYTVVTESVVPVTIIMQRMVPVSIYK